jgi:6-phosphofructokinase 1
MEARHHALIVVAEGAGQHLIDVAEERRDASGNRLHDDIGVFLKDRIKAYFADRDYPVTVKYIDPSYMIRSVPANAWDRVLAHQMARDAVHAAMAGRTDMLVGYWHGETVHVPLPAVISRTKQLNPSGEMWGSVVRATGQPRWGRGG